MGVLGMQMIIDSVISAEILNQQEHPELFQIVRSCMIHVACGHLNPNSRCMEDGVCTKRFPKNFLASTLAEGNGYPLYRCRDNGHDCAKIVINERIDHDKVQTFLDAQYVSAPEAVWRIFELNMHQQFHVVHRLPVHLPNNHIVYFQQEQAEEALDRAADQATKLTSLVCVKCKKS
ncbi:uncharacterized protein LOC130630062 [Hydractinia symbiolongicarpus]|uniref:uncharacterized protein LOC130630062 n=1 Tax=Hydractinia symbiolongicarpus TaxID=13093 RepID=UPI00254DD627|nr:uncharacterized protein LOC130630062 [Hydractinia symbiolongicarpus]